MDFRCEEDRRYTDKLRQELEMHKDLQHPNIVRCFGSGIIDGNFYVYLEYVAGGSLRARINEFGPLPAGPYQKATRGLLKGLKYLHTHNVAHRDLKGANVLVEGAYHVKLADFGCSKRSDHSMSFSQVGSLPWSAPEIWQNVGHGRSQDIWSFACTLIEMATAENPWGKGAFDNPIHAMCKISKSDKTPSVPEDLPNQAQDLINRCLQRKPSKRPNAVELLTSHPFVARPTSASSCSATSVGTFSRPLSNCSSRSGLTAIQSPDKPASVALPTLE
jgi:serine/threonine protein kinase